MKSLYANLKAVYSFVAAVLTASANGTGVDTQGYSDGLLVVQAGAIDLASGNETYTFTVEESDDNSSFSAVSGLSTTVTANNQTKLVALKNLGVTRKRYLRAVFTAAGTTPSCAFSAVILLGQPVSAPVN